MLAITHPALQAAPGCWPFRWVDIFRVGAGKARAQQQQQQQQPASAHRSGSVNQQQQPWSAQPDDQQHHHPWSAQPDDQLQQQPLQPYAWQQQRGVSAFKQASYEGTTETRQSMAGTVVASEAPADSHFRHSRRSSRPSTRLSRMGSEALAGWQSSHAALIFGTESQGSQPLSQPSQQPSQQLSLPFSQQSRQLSQRDHQPSLPHSQQSQQLSPLMSQSSRQLSQRDQQPSLQLSQQSQQLSPLLLQSLRQPSQRERQPSALLSSGDGLPSGGSGGGSSGMARAAGTRDVRLVPAQWPVLGLETRGSSSSSRSTLGSPLPCSEMIRAAVQAQAQERRLAHAAHQRSSTSQLMQQAVQGGPSQGRASAGGALSVGVASSDSGTGAQYDRSASGLAVPAALVAGSRSSSGSAPATGGGGGSGGGAPVQSSPYARRSADCAFSHPGGSRDAGADGIARKDASVSGSMGLGGSLNTRWSRLAHSSVGADPDDLAAAAYASGSVGGSQLHTHSSLHGRGVQQAQPDLQAYLLSPPEGQAADAMGDAAGGGMLPPSVSVGVNVHARASYGALEALYEERASFLRGQESAQPPVAPAGGEPTAVPAVRDARGMVSIAAGPLGSREAGPSETPGGERLPGAVGITDAGERSPSGRQQQQQRRVSPRGSTSSSSDGGGHMRASAPARGGVSPVGSAAARVARGDVEPLYQAYSDEQVRGFAMDGATACLLWSDL